MKQVSILLKSAYSALFKPYTITYDKPITKKYLEHKVKGTLFFMNITLPAKVKVITPAKIYELEISK
ncbi:hypothetical protein PBOR_15295 [Paenibacillus borealis]|uniref:Uncharacterized protein n=1 Tax=Paenibacillus borealis TaxID=160799 RepID=A0A089LBD1_PAEBO|nr:hypothetical protein PBOR_15295 [Paenibacillus borealis]